MRNTLKLALAIILFSQVTASFAQEFLTEGKLLSEAIISTDDPQLQPAVAMMGDQSVVTYFKDGKLRREQKGGMAGTNTLISDPSAGKALLLMDNIQGKNYAEIDLNEKNDKEGDLDVERTDETKEVLGYTCHKYIVEQEGKTVIIWAAETLFFKGQDKTKFGGKVKGIPLMTISELEVAGAVLTMTETVKEIVKERVSNDKFEMEIPKGYTKASDDVLKGKLGK